MGYLIGVDIGTSATKTVLFDETGKNLASASAEYPLYQPHIGWAEQAPQDWWRATAATIQKALNVSGVGASNISGVGLSGQMHGLVLLDKNNQVLRPSIIWCDQRTTKEVDELTSLIGDKRLIEITANPASTGFTAAKLLWVKNNEPDIFEKIHKILLPKDYVRFMLTGEFATEVSDASGMQLLDVPNRCWSKEILAKIGIQEDMLPKVYESCEISGVVTSHAAQETGLL